MLNEDILNPFDDDQAIIDLFDSNLSLTLQELSIISGRTVKELKELLLSE